MRADTGTGTNEPTATNGEGAGEGAGEATGGPQDVWRETLDLWVRAASCHLLAPRDPTLTEVYREACHGVLLLVPCPECLSSEGNCAPGGPSDPPRVAVLTTETGWIHQERVDALARLLTDWWEADQSVLQARVPDDFP